MAGNHIIGFLTFSFMCEISIGNTQSLGVMRAVTIWFSVVLLSRVGLKMLRANQKAVTPMFVPAVTDSSTKLRVSLCFLDQW